MDPITMFVLWSVVKGSGQGGASPSWPTPQDPPPVPTRGNGKGRGKRRRAPPPSPGADSAMSAPTTPDAAPPVPAPVEPPKAQQPADTAHRESAARQATSVLAIQRLINRHGGSVKPDGLFGPQTVTAWRTLAARKKLNPTIVRLSPKSADVARTTWSRLNAGAVSGGYDRPLYIP